MTMGDLASPILFLCKAREYTRRVLNAKKPRAGALLGCALTLGFVVLYLAGLDSVPFHPDESTQLYMSRDFDIAVLQHDPGALAWTPDQPLTPEARLRLLDAPLTKNLIGLGRWLQGYTLQDLNADWVWGAPWADNLGAIPARGLLMAARLPLALLGALAVLLVYLIGMQVGGAALGASAALLVGLDPLLLLHSRRAMAESALTFFSVLAALGILVLVQRCDTLKRLSAGAVALGALAGLAAGLAVDSKQTEAVMLPVALAAAALCVWQRPWRRPQKATALAALAFAIGAGWLVGVWLLNPVLYRQPLPVLQSMIALRADLAREQVAVNGARDPRVVLGSVPARLGAALSQLYFEPPAPWDVPVYLDQLQPPADAYFANPLNNLLRLPPLSLLLLALSALGVADSAARLWRDRLRAGTRAEQVLWLWSAATVTLLALTIPLNWQRYFMPLLTPSRLFASLGIVALVRVAMSARRLRPLTAVSQRAP